VQTEAVGGHDPSPARANVPGARARIVHANAGFRAFPSGATARAEGIDPLQGACP